MTFQPGVTWSKWTLPASPCTEIRRNPLERCMRSLPNGTEASATTVPEDCRGPLRADTCRNVLTTMSSCVTKTSLILCQFCTRGTLCRSLAIKPANCLARFPCLYLPPRPWHQARLPLRGRGCRAWASCLSTRAEHRQILLEAWTSSALNLCSCTRTHAHT